MVVCPSASRLKELCFPRVRASTCRASILERLQFESLSLHWASHYQEAVGALGWGVSARF